MELKSTASLPMQAVTKKLGSDAEILRDAVMQHLIMKGDWPKFRDIDIHLRPLMNVEATWTEISSGSSGWDLANDPNLPLRLPPRILLDCPGLEEGYAAFVQAFPTILSSFLQSPARQLRSQTLLEVGFPEDEVRRIGNLMWSCGFTTHGGTNGDGSWHWTLSGDVRDLDGMTTAREYVRWRVEQEKTFVEDRRRHERARRRASHPVGSAWLKLGWSVLGTVVGGVIVWWLTKS